MNTPLLQTTTLFCCLFLSILTLKDQVQTEWIKHWDGSDYEGASDATTGAMGNLIFTEYFEGSIDFNTDARAHLSLA